MVPSPWGACSGAMSTQRCSTVCSPNFVSGSESVMAFDVVVVGAGHAGCEAALAASRLGARVAVVTLRADRIAQMSCNPAIGGVAKGHVVREIDAMGGAMGKVADGTGIQFRRLNTS